MRNGSPMTIEPSASVPTYSSPVTIGPKPAPRSAVSSHANPPACQNTSTAIRFTVLRSMSNRVPVRVYSWLRA